jgi:hypothetical protein
MCELWPNHCLFSAQQYIRGLERRLQSTNGMLQTAKLVNRALRNSIEEAWRSLYGAQLGITEPTSDAIGMQHVCTSGNVKCLLLLWMTRLLGPIEIGNYVVMQFGDIANWSDTCMTNPPWHMNIYNLSSRADPCDHSNV